MNAKVSVRFKTRVMNLDGTIASERPWESNLILDQGLNGLANSGVASVTGDPAKCFRNLFVGSGTNPNSVTNGAITFTQAAFILTASAPIFTLAMVGQLFKYGTGTGGAEYYITGFTSNQIVTVDTSATVAVGLAGTIWNVTQTTLQTPLHVATSYQLLAGNCGSTQSGNTMTHQRYFVVPQQALQYTVNEIGYNAATIGTAAGLCVGRFVLSSSDVVANTQYYLVIMQVQVTYSPSNPTASGNVGTNINVAGDIMVETLGTVAVQVIDGTNGNPAGGSGGFDCQVGTNIHLYFPTVTYSQNGSITGAAGPDWSANNITLAAVGWTYASLRGTMQMTFSSSVTTAGETLYGIGIGAPSGAGNIILDVKFTTPQTAPVGLFQPDTVWQIVFDRILSN